MFFIPCLISYPTENNHTNIKATTEVALENILKQIFKLIGYLVHLASGSFFKT